MIMKHRRELQRLGCGGVCRENEENERLESEQGLMFTGAAKAVVRERVDGRRLKLGNIVILPKILNARKVRFVICP